KINSDVKLRELVSATVENGALKITSKKFGTAANFTLVSDVAAGANTTGLGAQPTITNGEDIEGTINGEAATGAGQFLTGKADNATTDGLQIMYTGNTIGSVGSLRFSKGIAALTMDAVGNFTDNANGLLTANDKSIEGQIETIGQSISALEERLTSREQFLRAKFTRMEQAISQLQSQQVRFSQFSQSSGR
ncbi:MAG TPA: flagellar filament capping protein FliD, partial [Fimbriimonadaceae bacterium]|nr:flagellar filament capping protein FliD [Fimbriimonadaceae bacterium]